MFKRLDTNSHKKAGVCDKQKRSKMYTPSLWSAKKTSSLLYRSLRRSASSALFPFFVWGRDSWERLALSFSTNANLVWHCVRTPKTRINEITTRKRSLRYYWYEYGSFARELISHAYVIQESKECFSCEEKVIQDFFGLLTSLFVACLFSKQKLSPTNNLIFQTRKTVHSQ